MTDVLDQVPELELDVDIAHILFADPDFLTEPDYDDCRWCGCPVHVGRLACDGCLAVT